MAVLLKNLLARSPKLDDMVAITELIKACDVDEYGIADSTMEDMSSNWHQPGFNLATDAWVIVTNKGQAVGFTCVWHRDYEQIFTFVCAHPEYRGRGIGTLLLRLVEERARQHVRNARPDTRVTLCGTVSSLNEQAKRLFEREGYTSIRKIWRIEVGANDSMDKSSLYRAFKADLDVESWRLVDATQLYDLDAIYIIREYEVYEKELRAGEKLPVSLEDELEILLAAG
ncbi:MAG TPA: GNAT family N-acetyltransferase [Ktedonobacteraceae bacterium]|nr:GNAT family N-acetyltransferase [Ktedonobacteraceae bacterium]